LEEGEGRIQEDLLTRVVRTSRDVTGMGETWAIVLAAGDGSRLRLLVRLIHDEVVPKQFATLVGTRSLLQTTIERVGACAPPARTMVVVDRSYEELARRQLADWPELEIVSQPRNRGTALGVLLALARLRRYAPDAAVAIFPSDHHVPRPASYLEGVRLSLRSSGVTLLGVAPERADSELGWILPDRTVGRGLQTVKRFVEKPNREVAEELFHQGALWNAFVIGGRVRDIWGLAAAHLPFEASAFEGACGPNEIDAIYRRERTVDFSRAVLEEACDLQVTRVEGTGWADWGTPERVLHSLEGTSDLETLLRRIVDGQERAGSMTPSLGSQVRAALQSSSELTWLPSSSQSPGPFREEAGAFLDNTGRPH
jgi:mannose-1-phosphate guanylyltransferase